MKNISSRVANFYQQFSSLAVKRNLGTVSPLENRITARELDKYVIGSIGLFFLFVVSFAIAVHRCERSDRIGRDRMIQIQSSSTSPH